MKENSRTRFIMGAYFLYLGKEWIRAGVYMVLAAFMMWNLLYLDIVSQNRIATEYNFKNLAGADYVRFDLGNAFKKFNNANYFYKAIDEVIGEGNYAFSPWIVAATDDGRNLFATNQSSLDVFAWNIEWGFNFGSNPNEVIAFKGAANIGDIVEFTTVHADKIFTEEFEVVGIYSSDRLAVAKQLTEERKEAFLSKHNDDGLVFRYNPYLKNLNFVTDKYDGFIINPRHEWAQRGEVSYYSSGVFIKAGVLDARGEEGLANELYACDFTDKNVAIDTKTQNTLEYIKGIGLAVLFVIFVFAESFLRLRKYKDELRTWNLCGMSEKEIKRTYTQIMAIPVFLGLVIGFVAYMIVLTKFTNVAWALLMIILTLGIFVLCQYLVNSRMVDAVTDLVPNEKKEFAGNRADETIQLLMDKSVRYNLRLPVELLELNEEAAKGAIDRGLGIGYMHEISEKKCSELSDYEILRVKIARAMTFMPKTLIIGKEWDKLNAHDQMELGRFLKQMISKWNVEVRFAQARIETSKVVKEIEEWQDSAKKEDRKD